MKAGTAQHSNKLFVSKGEIQMGDFIRALICDTVSPECRCILDEQKLCQEWVVKPGDVDPNSNHDHREKEEWGFLIGKKSVSIISVSSSYCTQ
jgi:hypothetical protein